MDSTQQAACKSDQLDASSSERRMGRRDAAAEVSASDCASNPTDDGLYSVAASGDQVRKLFLAAVSSQGGGHFAEAVALYNQVLLLDPSLPEAHSNLGAALAHLGRIDEAKSSLRRAISLRPDYPEAYGNLGLALKRSGRLEEAEWHLRCAVNLKPRWAEVLSKLGITLYEMGRLSEAQASLCQAVAVKPDLLEAVVFLAATLKDLRKPEESVAVYRQAIALEPFSAELFSGLATVLLELGRTNEAVSCCRRAIGLKPDLAEAHNNLGMALRNLGMLDEAEAALRKAIALCPDFTEPHNNLGNVLLDQGRPDRAVAIYRKAIALSPESSIAYNNIGVALKELGYLEEALQVTEQAIRLAPRTATYYRSLCELRRFIAGEPHLATMEQMAEDARSLSLQEQIELRFALAKAYDDVGQYECSFRQLLEANALKRSQIEYQETEILAGLKRVPAVFTPELIDAHKDVGLSSSVPVFIVGMLRSGSTLVEQILASHSRVFGAGELKHFGDAAAALGRPEGALTELPESVPTMAEAFRGLGTRYLAEIEKLAPTALRIVDKMPSNFALVGLIHLALPNASIIHTVRDPVDTCVSCFSKLFTEEQNHTYDLAELGRYYRHYEALMSYWRRVLPPGRILDVRYEELVSDLEAMARRIIAHCGLEWDARCLDFHQLQRPVRTASATQVRQPLYTSAIGRWRHYQQFLGPLLAELGTGPRSAYDESVGEKIQPRV